ncbi:MAG: hypothetical protein EOR30_14045 [Mesorhizobium sp.]|uniref:hypothetical protein n=1 Tax=unclassified Mesorhizobium TaxID=325217 RepID=UPI000FC9DE7F|nr:MULTISPECIES: hypothetical protein [unclassified Mesorhizobium]RUV70311.1 hypothetical protein EOA78_21050 [Mesorhizobium sp. M5C.F.Cr.IN.023.01.1.1]RWF80658.1 MAG: hypothetical protein EOQ36_32290 [Mesorhizobium sp.]RWF92423.1 MAG: hypothetical protein EOQ45_21180 [Mesorhizobium sp.]RWI40305.1 MAG: hypothetical protein EOR14_14075 [Mesorhizobium sp.]RWI52249.1 MAG: hypothetical protein EOR16_27460 [Mesorhizobium sp.]
MTLVVLYGTEERLICGADTRLTSDSQTISERGGKLAVVPVRWGITGPGLEESSVSFFSLGFAFAGSTLLANSTHAIATTCSQILHTGRPNAAPSSDLIAQIYARAGEDVTKDVNSRLHPESSLSFEGFLFGYCPVKQTFRNHTISPVIRDGVFSMAVESFDVKDGDLFAIGSGVGEFVRLSERRDAAGNRPPPLNILQEIMRSGSVSSVGGYPQIAFADKMGVQLQPVLQQNPDDPDQAILAINGFDVSKISSDEGFSFGLTAVGMGTEAIHARKALRAKGIDPDAGPVHQFTQNLASFEAWVEMVHFKKAPARLDGSFTLAPQLPKGGAWYFVAPCKCGRRVPYVLDPSKGKMGNPFIGDGRINTICMSCGEKARAGAAELFSFQWTY